MSPDTYLPILLPVVVVGLVLLRNRKPRPLSLGRMWILPVVVAVLIGMGLYFTPHAPLGPGAWAGFIAAGLLGAAAGWWRGKTVRIERTADGRLLAQASPLGLILLLALFAARALFRLLAERQGAAWHMDAAVVTDALMIFAVTLVAVQRLEMWLRARRLA